MFVHNQSLSMYVENVELTVIKKDEVKNTQFDVSTTN